MTKERITDENCHDTSMTKLNGERTQVRPKPRGTGPVGTENTIYSTSTMHAATTKKAAFIPVRLTCRVFPPYSNPLTEPEKKAAN